MGFFKSLGRTVLGHDSGPKTQILADNKYQRQWKEDSLSHFAGLNQLADAWYGNQYLRDLIAPSHESRVVSRETSAIRGGVQTAKANIRQTAARGRLGKAFAARQEYEAEERGLGATSAVHGKQAERRNVVGAQRESQYTQTKADIEGAEFADKRAQENFRLQKNTRFEIGRDRNRQAMRGKMIQLGAAIAGGVAGGFGVGGLGASAGVGGAAGTAAGGFSGVMAGASLGSSIGGALGGGGQQAFGQNLSQAFGGYNVPRMPEVVGFSPFLSYAMGQIQGQERQTYGSGRIQLPQGPTSYNQGALDQAANN